jgi:hypothetical protein
LNLPPQVEQAYLAEAHAKGLSLEDLVRDVPLARQPTPDPNELPPDEWKRRFLAWTHSHPTDTPPLSDEAISRESIYGDRGL